MLPGRKFSPQEVLRILTRRGWLIVLLFAGGLSATPLLARLVPELYRSETMIMVIPQRIPDQYVKSTVTATVEDRLPSISNQILSRSRLERTITDFNLYVEQRASGIMEDVVQRMRANITVVNLEGEDSFRVSYVSSDPRTAQQVTARLASLYIEENLRDRENLAEETNLFLESQLDEAKKRLIEHEQKLEAYRRRFSGQLPSQLNSNLQAIQNAQLQLQSVSESINRARERRLLLERQMGDTEAFPVLVAQPPAVATAPDQPATTARQLEIVQVQLDLQRLRYTPDHPNVRSLERTIRELQAKVEEEKTLPPPEKPKLPSPAEVAELARQKRVKDLQAELDIIDRQLAVSQAEESRLKQVMADYQSKVEIVPTRESELVELTRDYGTLQAAYTSLLTKKEDSKIAANLERRQIGEQFRILDPASLPERPYNQTQRLAIMASGAAAGLALGLLLVAFREYLDSSLRNEEAVMRILTLPVLAVVPVMESRGERRARRCRTLAANLAAGLALVGSVAVVAAWRLQWLQL